MMDKIFLRDIAHARSGDKGNDSNVSVWVYDIENYELAKRVLSPTSLKQRFSGLFLGTIELFELPVHGGFNLVLRDSLEGGVNRSLNLDGHGKSWSSLLLSIPLEEE